MGEHGAVDLSSPDEEICVYADALVAATERGLAPWVVAQVERRAAGLRDVASEAAAVGCPTIIDELRQLVGQDIEAQASTPLSVLRGAAAIPNQVLRDAGVPLPQRAAFDRQAFPDDDYDCAPHGWSDLGDDIAAAGLAWGAAKAYVHLQRRRG